MNQSLSNIREWAIARNLHTAEPTKQMLKLGEEYGELCGGMARGKMDVVKDSIGDMFVVMVILSQQLGVDIEECIADAYETIKDRTGMMINGVFVKEEDLKRCGICNEVLVSSSPIDGLCQKCSPF
jgi:NTP pyrophosphatase (non-canonical NTP hydrolase)